MRQLLRWAFKFAAVVSVVLSVGVGLLWAWSYQKEIHVPFNRQGLRWEVVSASGRFTLDNAPQQALERRQWDEQRSRIVSEYESYVSKLGPQGPVGGAFDPRRKVLRSMLEMQGVPRVRTPLRRHSLPHYVPFAATMLLPMLAILRLTHNRKLRHRRKHDLCPSCGYDLRATPGRCPECGTVPALFECRSGNYGSV